MFGADQRAIRYSRSIASKLLAEMYRGSCIGGWGHYCWYVLEPPSEPESEGEVVGKKLEKLGRSWRRRELRRMTMTRMGTAVTAHVRVVG